MRSHTRTRKWAILTDCPRGRKCTHTCLGLKSTIFLRVMASVPISRSQLPPNLPQLQFVRNSPRETNVSRGSVRLRCTFPVEPTGAFFRRFHEAVTKSPLFTFSLEQQVARDCEFPELSRSQTQTSCPYTMSLMSPYLFSGTPARRFGVFVFDTVAEAD